jgi:hypothetical protein
MRRAKFTLVLLLLVTAAIGHVIFVDNGIPGFATAQPINETSEGIVTSGNQTMGLGGTGDLVPYSNPNLGFSLEFPSNWQKQETLRFLSPGIGLVGSPEAISVLTEEVPTLNYTVDNYTEDVMGQIESLPDFQLINSSSTTLGGLPAHMIGFSFTDLNNNTSQSLQAWTVKDGIAYVITYGGTPEEFNSSLPAMQSVLSTFRLQP